MTIRLLPSGLSRPLRRSSSSAAAILLAAILALGAAGSAPEAKAMDPVTIGILAPILMPYAIAAAQYCAKGMMRAAPAFVDCGISMLDIFRLPLGITQILLLWPLDTGYLVCGLENLWDGGTAPFMMIYHLLVDAPLRFFGAMG